MKKIIFYALILLGIFTIWFYINHPLGVKVTIDNHAFMVDVALTEEQKELGLGYRDHLDANRGMLFVYDHPDRYSFWMKGMKFPLDMIWIKDNNIVDISKTVPVATSEVLPIYTPKVPVNKVLEVNAGTADSLNMQIGDVVHITL